MGDQPITRPSLLARIRDQRDTEAWSQFAAIYSPLVYRFVRRRGLQAGAVRPAARQWTPSDFALPPA
jgi:RNA polymerase sigma-70 factor, ECF subfamily